MSKYIIFEEGGLYSIHTDTGKATLEEETLIELHLPDSDDAEDRVEALGGTFRYL